jgi:DNA-binding LacI/PurR family transcriptional regulator
MSQKEGRRVTVKDIARKAGFSATTVSLALKDDPRINASTRSRIQELAREMGYRPDPRLAQLMKYLQRGKAHGEGEIMGLLTDFTEDQLESHPYMSGIIRGIRERSDQLGYGTSLFIEHKAMTLKRIHGILTARSIRGLIVLPFRERTFELEDFDFSCFSAVAIGYGMERPQLHRAASQQTLGAMQVVNRVLEAGYERVGLVLSREIDIRTQHRYLAGFYGTILGGEEKAAFLDPFVFEEMDLERFRGWFEEQRPDAIVASHHWIGKDLARLGIEPGRDIGLALINYQGSEPYARMRVPYEEIGRAGVNIVHGLLGINERGVPQHPSVMTVPGVWENGPSLPSRQGMNG